MLDISTGYPQLISALIAVVALGVSLVSIGIVVITSRKIRNDFPGKTLINELRSEVSTFSGELADVNDRFARFQKREGMRAAREEKAITRTLKEQALEIAAQGASREPQTPEEIKMALRRKLRGMNG